MTNVFNIKDGSDHTPTDIGSHGKKRQLEIKMDNLKRMLSARYKTIDKLLEQLDKIEQDCKGLETKYNIIIMDYGKRIGVSAVPAEYLDYTTAIKFEQDENGTIIMALDTDATITRSDKTPDPEEAA